jgi:acyl-CoA synthetase (AMP-forming)/AMP-acid ligase II
MFISFNSNKVNINPSYKYKELAYVLKMCGIKGLVSDTKYGLQHYEDILQKAVSENPNLLLEFIAYRGDTFTEINGTRTFSFDNFREESDSNYVTEVEEIIHKTQMDDFVNIQFTSGTTGNPKGATLTHHNILNNALALTASNRVEYGDKINSACHSSDYRQNFEQNYSILYTYCVHTIKILRKRVCTKGSEEYLYSTQLRGYWSLEFNFLDLVELSFSLCNKNLNFFCMHILLHT